ncbi:TRAP transporter small permease subunit [Jiella sonneratiae]|uniref:TRAP transporter small permease protein n=1 Tax=Jiella sonneratiae TaxID=2816856 RepID=A0ABS3J8U9_9HYPH|nr:TRAP transporter small permease subunit [Jiella sonneratiae]MBO0906096.1 TRAP transporter small permease subunit [Jiella sonneratiae]
MLETTLRQISLVMSRLGGGMLLAAALLVAVEVSLRMSRLVIFSVGTELSSYALAVGAAWSFAHVVFERAHVRVDVVSQRLPPLPRAFFDVLAMASLAVVGFLLTLAAWTTFATTLALDTHSNTTLATPLAVPQGLWVAGIGWFTFIAAYRTATAAAALLRRDLAEVTRIAAPPSAEDEASEAALDARSRMEAES